MSEYVRAKKHLGQHFLKDEKIAADIAAALIHIERYKKALEIGPGMGVLTKYLVHNPAFETSVIEIDRESIAYLKNTFPELGERIIEGDFLRYDLEQFTHEPFAVIGNFPYNISSQILFKVLEHRNQVPEVVGMFQKEVAERLASKPRNKSYGITSVLLQAFYDIEYLFTVHENVFTPPPKVKSAVIRLTRNLRMELGVDEKLFFKVVKTGFNQRRKMLGNALKPLQADLSKAQHFLNKRAEELSVEDFIELTHLVTGQ
jgi:16S rRNA (adenine1518-N6/adenine1519-N6)-dimethyltransferase